MLNSEPTPTSLNLVHESPPAFDSPHETVLTPHGEIDLTRKSELEDLVDRVWEPTNDLVIDLRQVTFIDASCLHWLIDTQMKVEAADRRFAVFVPGTGIVRRVLEIAGLDQLMIGFEAEEVSA